MFLPGVTVPVVTSYYDPGERSGYIWLHALLSVAVYFGEVWMYSAGGWMIVLGGASGSLLYLVLTKWLLGTRLSYKVVFMVALLSGIVFVPEWLSNKGPFQLGIGIFLWTIINGWVLNVAYRDRVVEDGGIVFDF